MSGAGLRRRRSSGSATRAAATSSAASHRIERAAAGWSASARPADGSRSSLQQPSALQAPSLLTGKRITARLRRRLMLCASLVPGCVSSQCGRPTSTAGLAPKRHHLGRPAEASPVGRCLSPAGCQCQCLRRRRAGPHARCIVNTTPQHVIARAPAESALAERSCRRREGPLPSIRVRAASGTRSLPRQALVRRGTAATSGSVRNLISLALSAHSPSARARARATRVGAA